MEGQGLNLSVLKQRHTSTMKWKIIAFLAAVLTGYSMYDDFNPGVLNGKNVVITGASAGIGEQIAYHYAHMGARIMITARTEANLQKVVAKCKQEGSPEGVYLYHVADMSDPDAPAKLVQAAEQQLGAIDFLVLNHISPNRLAPWLSTHENLTYLEHIFNVNFMAYTRLASSAMPALQTSNGSIVVVSSFAGRVSSPYIVPYSSTKFALDGFFTGLRQELNINNVDVSVTICYIGLVDTASGMQAIQDFGAHRMVQQVTPANPQDVAYAVIRGGALRLRSVFYPYRVRLLVLIHSVFPSSLETVMASVFALD